MLCFTCPLHDVLRENSIFWGSWWSPLCWADLDSQQPGALRRALHGCCFLLLSRACVCEPDLNRLKEVLHLSEAPIDTCVSFRDFSVFLHNSRHRTNQSVLMKMWWNTLLFFHVFWEVLINFSYCFTVFWLHFCGCL